jgi:phosphatidate cytidylyltransferase
MKKEKTIFQSLGTRLIVAAVWIAICLVVLLVLPVWATGILETIAAFFMAKELVCNTGLIKNKLIQALCIIQAISIPWFIYFDADLYGFIAMMFVFVFVLFFAEITSKQKIGTNGIFAAFFGAYVFPFFISLLVPMMNLNNGRYLVLIPFISAWCSDAGAYFIGSKFGKHKLAPSISPKKSIEGAFGGVAGGILGMLIYGIILHFCKTDVPWLIFVFMGVLGSVFGLLGDLFLSYIKRDCKIKDFGNFLPGHGGVLDRFDSVLFVVPVCYYLFLIV